MMLYVSLGTLFWTHTLAVGISAVSSAIWVYFVVKK